MIRVLVIGLVLLTVACAKENPHAPPQGPRVSEPLGQALFCLEHPKDWLCQRQ